MFSLALRNLLIRKARTGLAAAGLVIALLGMIALVSLSGGVELLLRETLEILPGVMVLKKDLPSPALSTVSEEYTAQVAAIPGVIAAVPEIIFPAPSIDGSSLLRSGDPFKMYVVLGVYPAEIAQLPGGGLFARKLLRGRANNAGAAEVMMPRAATEAFEKDVGDVINIAGHDLTITGVFEIGSLLLDRGLVIDMALAREISRKPEGTVSAIYAELDPEADPKAVKAAIEAAIPAVEAQTTEDSMRDFDTVSGPINQLLAAISLIALIVGATGIVNTMLMSVIERTKEFGILRAVGWRQRDIVQLVVTESALLGVIGGIVGCILGVVGIRVASLMLPIQLAVSPWLLVGCFALAVVLGAGSGLYPAVRAARMDPIEAIRS